MNILDIIQDCLNLSYVNGLSIKEITIAAPNGTVIIKPENKGNKE